MSAISSATIAPLARDSNLITIADVLIGRVSFAVGLLGAPLAAGLLADRVLALRRGDPLAGLGLAGVAAIVMSMLVMVRFPWEPSTKCAGGPTTQSPGNQRREAAASGPSACATHDLTNALAAS